MLYHFNGVRFRLNFKESIFHADSHTFTATINCALNGRQGIGLNNSGRLLSFFLLRCRYIGIELGVLFDRKFSFSCVMRHPTTKGSFPLSGSIFAGAGGGGG